MMYLYDLPKAIKTLELERFDFGDAEGLSDSLLEKDANCFCRIQPISEFLKGKKVYVVGERGTGKTAVYRLINDNVLKFDNPLEKTQIILPISESYQYRLIKEQILPLINSTITDDSARYRYVWEVYLIYRILISIKSNFPDTEKLFSTFLSIFATNSKNNTTLFDIIKSVKISVGCKLGQALGTGMPLPDFYLSAQPVSDNKEQGDTKKDAKIIEIDLDNLKVSICEILKRNKSVLYVLMDSLDEFVIKEEYDVQRMMLHGLIESVNGYIKYAEIKPKVFIRSDLFSKINFEEIQYDKMIDKTIELTWTDEEIREFIARRIAYNYIINIDEIKSLRISDGSNMNSVSRLQTFKHILINLYAQIYYFVCRDKSIYKDKYDAKTVNFNDRINKILITSMLPREVKHFDNNGVYEKKCVFEYLSTHFNLADERTTPRVIQLFISKTFSMALDYHKKNDILSYEILLNEENEYPIVTRDALSQAYTWFQNFMWENIISFTPTSKWKTYISKIQKNVDNNTCLDFEALKTMINLKDNEELTQFLAFLCHVRILKCTNPKIEYYKRQYTVPVVFRKVYQDSTN